MKQKDKELLLKDLCSRLPYGVIVASSLGFVTSLTWEEMRSFDGGYKLPKPYLRPMSSMTREECNEYGDLCHVEVDTYANIYEYDTIESIDWLNAHHFDYRGLIDKGLALEAPEGMYKEE